MVGDLAANRARGTYLSSPKRGVRVVLDMSDEQAVVLAAALDLFLRVGIGQLENVDEVWTSYYPASCADQVAHDLAVRYLMAYKAGMTGYPPNASHSICSPVVHEVFKVATDIHDVVRNARAWHRQPEGGVGVDFYSPFHHAQTPLPAVKIRPARKRPSKPA